MSRTWARSALLSAMLAGCLTSCGGSTTTTSDPTSPPVYTTPPNTPTVPPSECAPGYPLPGVVTSSVLRSSVAVCATESGDGLLVTNQSSAVLRLTPQLTSTTIGTRTPDGGFGDELVSATFPAVLQPVSAPVLVAPGGTAYVRGYAPVSVGLDLRPEETAETYSLRVVGDYVGKRVRPGANLVNQVKACAEQSIAVWNPQDPQSVSDPDAAFNTMVDQVFACRSVFSSVEEITKEPTSAQEEQGALHEIATSLHSSIWQDLLRQAPQALGELHFRG